MYNNATHAEDSQGINHPSQEGEQSPSKRFNVGSLTQKSVSWSSDHRRDKSSEFMVDEVTDNTFEIEDSKDGTKKKGQFKHLLDHHDLKSIVSGKRNRKPAEKSLESKEEKSPYNLKRRLHTENYAKNKDSIRQLSKLQAKVKAKGETRLNKIFGRASNPAIEQTEVIAIPKEIFENYFEKLKKVRVEPEDFEGEKFMERRKVLEVIRSTLHSDESNANGLFKNAEGTDGEYNNTVQSTKPFSLQKATEYNFMKAIPSIENQLNHRNYLEELQKKCSEKRKTGTKGPNRNMLMNAQKHQQLPFNPNLKTSSTFINCDIRYFNFDFLRSKLGSFDVILMDPPWKESEEVDKFVLQAHNTSERDIALLSSGYLSNQEIMNISVEKISTKGFIFLWIPTKQLNIAYEMMNRWGYEVVDQIIWVKMKDSKINVSPGDYFMHSFEMCLLGYKNSSGEHVEYNSKISNNVIFADVRKEFQKPDEIYEIIELMMPGAKKIELFGLNHNRRPGWFTLGNRLGDEYNKWYNQIGCNNCNETIKAELKRYKAKYQANYDICENCFLKLGLDKNLFFEMSNSNNQDVFHDYHSCKSCLSTTIWGTRFTCLDCENYDLCEICFDQNLQNHQKFHDIDHNFHAFEVPIHSFGLPVQDNLRCFSCHQKPILGLYFNCVQCFNFNLCQNCFFSKPIEERSLFAGHQPFHTFTFSTESKVQEVKAKCAHCDATTFDEALYKCDECFNLYLCEKCYFKKDNFKMGTAHSHKFSHNFTKLKVNH